MTDRLHSCKESPDGKHHIVTEPTCRYCHRTVSYLNDMGWNAPKVDPDAVEASWDQEADVNDSPSARFLR